jgi:mono/diheme cytochrome c family protein
VLAGGRAIETPFGTFYSPNITPDSETGIGDWSEEDFVRAMTEGLSPSGAHYYPVFPYTSYARMSRQDLGDLWAYLSAREPVARRNRGHELWWPFRWRWLLSWWKWLYLDGSGPVSDPSRSDQWNRGAYLVNGPAHCGECHTPRNALGGPDTGMALAGTPDGPEGELVPNITPDSETGIGNWHPADLTWLLQTGLLPDGDSVQGSMAEAIDHGYASLDPEDHQAIAEYIFSVPPVKNAVE